MKLFFLCPDYNIPSAGTRTIYRHVDILNSSGIDACVLHEREGFRCTWFEHSTRIVYPPIHPSREDIIVIPEIYGHRIQYLYPGVKKVIFNQNASNTFSATHNVSYSSSDIVAVVAGSEEIRDYLEYAFLDLKVLSTCYSIDHYKFYFGGDKKQQISYMTNKRQQDIVEVLSILSCRGVLKDWALMPIENKSENETARILRESKIFLSFNQPEGFSLTASEAIACGCAVVGYAMSQYFKSISSLWHVSLGDVLAFAQKIERVIDLPLDSAAFKDRLYRDSHRIQDELSIDKETEKVFRVWREVLEISSKRTVPWVPKYSIIIPCWNGIQVTKACVDSVFACSDDFELICMDNCSTDGTAELLSSYATEYSNRVRVISNAENLGWVKAVNQGLREARGEFLVFMNNDVTVSSGWLDRMAAHFHFGVGAVVPTSPNGGWRQNSGLSGPNSEPVRFITGFCVMLSREVYDRVGSLDERLTHGADDLDLSFRLFKLGYQLLIARDVVVEHLGGASFELLLECGGKFGSVEYSEFMEKGIEILRDIHGDAAVNWLFGRTLVPPWNSL